MKLPSQHSKLGKVLRAMVGAGALTAGSIRRRAGLPVDTAITARVRELRDYYGCTIPPAERRKQLDGSTLYLYRLEAVPYWMAQALANETERARLASVGVGSQGRAVA